MHTVKCILQKLENPACLAFKWGKKINKTKKKDKLHIRQKCDVVIDFTRRLQIQKDNKSKVWVAVGP